jgi:hypothetical protein
MIEIVWDNKFKRTYKSWSKKHPDLDASLNLYKSGLRKKSETTTRKLKIKPLEV